MSQVVPKDTSVQAVYADGYIHDETELSDISPYDATKNVFNDILEKRPEAEHGRMVRFSVFYKNMRYDIDWRLLSDNARPIRFRDGFHSVFPDGHHESGYSACRMGYQFTDQDGKDQKFIREL